jgi:hypothetical protein
MTEKITIEEHLWSVSNFIGQLANIGIAMLKEELVDKILTNLSSRVRYS